MPVKSEKQRRFMYASLAGKTDVPPSVAKKFVGPSAHKADGGSVKGFEMKKMVNGGAAAAAAAAAERMRGIAGSRPAPGPGSGARLRPAPAPDMPPRSMPTRPAPPTTMPIRPPAMKKGGKATAYAKGGGIESKGKTKGKVV